MKRLFVTSEYPPIIGGQATYFRNLWADSDPSGDLLLLPHRCREYASRFPGRNYCFCRAPLGTSWPARILRVAWVTLCVLRLASKHRPAEIHAGQFFSAGVAALACRLFLGTPYVLYVFGADIMELSGRAVMRAVSRAILGRCRGVISCSHFTMGFIRRTYTVHSPLFVVNPGVEERYFSPDAALAGKLREKYGLADKRVLITVGRLVERKGHDIVIGCLRALKKKVPDIHYLIVGDGPNRATLERLARAYGVRSDVTFCGAIPYGELPAHYLLGEVFIMISRQIDLKGDVEGFGIVYLEANAAGLPVIGARTGGTPDAVSHEVNGLLVEDAISEPQIIAAAESLFLDEPFRCRMAASAGLFALEHSWEGRRRAWQEALQVMRMD